MADYRRWHSPGGTFFFTVVTEDRVPLFNDPTARQILRESIVACQHSRAFELDAMVLLPDHLHAIWTLPAGDDDYSPRWGSIKATFTHRWLELGGVEKGRTGSRVHTRRRGVWQRRFWERLIRDPADLERHFDYLHFNPVKHGYVACPQAWEFSTFRKWVGKNRYAREWGCACDGRSPYLEFEGFQGYEPE